MTIKTLLIIAIGLGIATLGVWVLGTCVGFCSPASSVQAAEAKTSTFRVEGMTCGGCAAGLKMTVKKLDGVQKAEASYEEGKAVVTYDPSKLKPEQIIAAIEKLGYKATLQKSEGEKK